MFEEFNHCVNSYKRKFTNAINSRRKKRVVSSHKPTTKQNKQNEKLMIDTVEHVVCNGNTKVGPIYEPGVGLKVPMVFATADTIDVYYMLINMNTLKNIVDDVITKEDTNDD